MIYTGELISQYSTQHVRSSNISLKLKQNLIFSFVHGPDNDFLLNKLNESYLFNFPFLCSNIPEITWRVLYTVQEMLSLPEHLISLPAFSGVRIVSYLLFITVDVNVFWFYESLFTPWFWLLWSYKEIV